MIDCSTFRRKSWTEIIWRNRDLIQSRIHSLNVKGLFFAIRWLMRKGPLFALPYVMERKCNAVGLLQMQRFILRGMQKRFSVISVSFPVLVFPGFFKDKLKTSWGTKFKQRCQSFNQWDQWKKIYYASSRQDITQTTTKHHHHIQHNKNGPLTGCIWKMRLCSCVCLEMDC